MSLSKILNDRLALLENRKFMIPRYVEQDVKFLGRNAYSLDMLLQIQEEIDETKAAIKGIEDWRKTKKEFKVLSTTGKPGKE